MTNNSLRPDTNNVEYLQTFSPKAGIYMAQNCTDNNNVVIEKGDRVEPLTMSARAAYGTNSGIVGSAHSKGFYYTSTSFDGTSFTHYITQSEQFVIIEKYNTTNIDSNYCAHIWEVMPVFTHFREYCKLCGARRDEF